MPFQGHGQIVATEEQLFGKEEDPARIGGGHTADLGLSQGTEQGLGQRSAWGSAGTERILYAGQQDKLARLDERHMLGDQTGQLLEAPGQLLDALGGRRGRRLVVREGREEGPHEDKQTGHAVIRDQLLQERPKAIHRAGAMQPEL